MGVLVLARDARYRYPNVARNRTKATVCGDLAFLLVCIRVEESECFQLT